MSLRGYILSAAVILLTAAAIIAEPASPVALTGFEPWPPNTIFLPGPYGPRRDEPDLIGERFAVGTTWYDYQSNGTLGKMIALDENANIHIVWMKGVQDVGAGERHCFYNYVIDGQPQIEGGANVDGLARGGYNNIGYSPAVGAIPIFHATQEGGQAWTFFAEDEELGLGAFTVNRMLRPDGGVEFIWPKGAADRNGRIHILARNRNEDANGNATTLAYMTAAPGDDGWQFDNARIIGSIKGIGYCVAASSVSDRVALVFPSQAYPAGENPRFAGGFGVAAANNNVLSFESADGVNFDWDNPTNTTRVLRPNPQAAENSPLRQGDTLRAVLFVDAIYDAADNLHVVFSAVSFWEVIDPNANPGYDANRYQEKRNMLWHWDRESDQLSLIASGLYNSDGNPGNWRQNLSFPSLGAATDGALYCAWTQYPEQGDRAANGLVNGEIYANVSLDGGVTWSVPINLTDTHAPDGNAGECRSESWSTLAAVVDNNLHISYVNDLDPGGAVQNEGVATENDFMYHRVARDDIPTEPRQLGMDFHVGAPPGLEIPNDPLNVVGIPGGDPAVTFFTIRNPVEDATGLWFRTTVSEQLAGLVHLNPPAGRIASGGELEVEVVFAPQEEGIVEGEIQVYHNAPGVNSPIVLQFDGLAAAGFGGLSGRVTDLATGNAVRGADLLLVPGGYRTASDEQGRYAFARIPALHYTVTCWHDEFLPFSEVRAVGVDEQNEFDIALRFATFELSERQVEVSMAVDEAFDARLRMSNRGNGPVAFAGALIFPGGGNVEPWAERLYFPAGQAINDTRLNGAAFAGDFTYVTGGNAGRGRGLIYLFDREGNHARSFSQFVDSPFGMRDLAWDGQHFWGGDARTLFVFDPEGNLIRTVNGPINPSRNLAWDTDRNILWVCDVRSQIYAINSEGEEVARFRQPDTTRIYGFAYYAADPDSCPLYVLSSTDAHPNQLYKVNPANRAFRAGPDLPVRNDDRAGGFEITSDFDPYSYVIAEVLQGNPDGVAIYQVSARTDWVNIAPVEGVIAAGEAADLTVHLDTHGLPVEGRFEAITRFEHNGRGQITELPITLIVTAEGGLTRRTLNMGMGWNMVSLNLEPETADVVELLSPLVQAGQLLLAKDGLGRFYRPAQNFNNIPRWEAAEGYHLKLSSAARLEAIGGGIPFNRPIPLTRGWHIVSYYPRASVDVTVALAGIVEHLIVVKDAFGRFYLPSRHFSNMDLMREGQGYQMKVDADVDLVYRLGQQAATPTLRLPSHFRLPPATSSNMSILLEGLPECLLEIAALGACNDVVGVGVRDVGGRAGVAVWAAEEGEIGLAPNELLRFVGWNGQSETPLKVEWTLGKGTFAADEVAVGRAVGAETIPLTFALYEPFPNPFNSTARVRFDLPDETIIKLALYDAAGRELARLIEGRLSAGVHRVTLQAGDLPSGVYFCRIEAGARRQTVKAMLLR